MVRRDFPRMMFVFRFCCARPGVDVGDTGAGTGVRRVILGGIGGRGTERFFRWNWRRLGESPAGVDSGKLQVSANEAVKLGVIQGRSSEATKRMSILGKGFDTTPMVKPVRALPDSVMQLMVGDVYVGRGCRQRGLQKSIFCNPYTVSTFGREMAINLFEQFLDHNEELQRSLWTLSGTRLLRHCALSEACHAAALILKFAELYQPCDDRDSSEQRPTDRT